MKEEIILELAEEIYFYIIVDLKIQDKCIEDDPDNKNGTQNTELGKKLYLGIETILRNRLT